MQRRSQSQTRLWQAMDPPGSDNKFLVGHDAASHTCQAKAGKSKGAADHERVAGARAAPQKSLVGRHVAEHLHVHDNLPRG